MRALFILICGATMLLASIFSSATTHAENIDTSCTVFLDDVDTMGALFEDLYLTWAIHRMAHHNQIARQQGLAGRLIDLDLIDIDTQRKFLLDYCEQNPEREFVDGVALLYDQFPKGE